MLYMPCAYALPSIFVLDGLLLDCFHASRNVVEQVKSFLLLTDDKKNLSLCCFCVVQSIQISQL